jgi:hypothetical protein
MYVVNQQVKNGLLSGRYKKNYRFVCSKWMTTTTITHLALLSQLSTSYTLNSDCTVYAHIEPTQPTGSVSITVAAPGGGGASGQTINHQYGVENLESLGYCAAGTQISVIYNGSTYPTVGLTTANLMITSERWVEQFTIDNDTLVAESVNLDERMCSGDKLKYGLCEGSSLEFQYFNHVNIKGYRIQAFIDVDYGYSNPKTIPMGYFIVEKCSRQASTGIMKATAYNKLQSDYLNAKANYLLDTIHTDTDDKNKVSVWAIQKQLLEDYEIEENDGTPSTLVGQDNTLSELDSSFTFKFSDSNNTYYPIIGWKAKGFTIPSGKKLKISSLTKFINKLQAQQEKLWTGIRQNCQNAETVISSLKGNTLFQMVSGVAAGFYNYSGTVPNPHYELRPVLIKVFSNTITSGRSLVTNVYSIADLTSINNQLKVMEKLTDSLYFMNAQSICFFYITKFGGSRSSSSVTSSRYAFNDEDIYFEDDDFENAYYTPTASEKILLPIENLSDFTLRELVSANYEISCKFGQLERETDLFKGVNLLTGTSRLSIDPSMYSQLWADEGNVHKWRNLIITYKGIVDGQEKDIVYQKQINADGTDDYYCSDNWLFRNLVWTSDRIYYYATEMVNSMRYITWFPFELWCAGLPYMETGDRIDIPYNGNTYSSYILQRQLKGIQNLQDTYINGTLDIF